MANAEPRGKLIQSSEVYSSLHKGRQSYWCGEARGEPARRGACGAVAWPVGGGAARRINGVAYAAP